MKDEIVSFELAKLAKEKGFNYSDKYHSWVYDIEDEGLLYMNEIMYKTDKLINQLSILAPSRSLLQKWLREHYKINITVDILSNGLWWFCIRNFADLIVDDDHTTNRGGFKTYEEGLEEGLKYILTNFI